MTAYVARVGRTRQVEGRDQSLAIAHQRLMVLMLLFSAVAFVIALRLLWLSVFADGGNGRGGVDALMPPRASTSPLACIPPACSTGLKIWRPSWRR